jgi:hypothetical protein
MSENSIDHSTDSDDSSFNVRVVGRVVELKDGGEFIVLIFESGGGLSLRKTYIVSVHETTGVTEIVLANGYNVHVYTSKLVEQLNGILWHINTDSIQ